MLVELVGKSARGVFALAKNQGATPRSLIRRRVDGLWRLRVILPMR